jgi:hypothetical protein
MNTNHICLSLAIVVIVALSCESDKIVVSKYPNGKIKQQFWCCIYQINDTIKGGPYVAFYSNGQKAEEGFYWHNYKDSIWKYWFENGNKEKTETWSLTSLNGPCSLWFSDGRIQSEGNYNRNIKEGKWQFFEPGGYYQAGQFVNGNKEGFWKEVKRNRTNDIIREWGDYSHGKRNGYWVKLDITLEDHILEADSINYRNDSAIFRKPIYFSSHKEMDNFVGSVCK